MTKKANVNPIARQPCEVAAREVVPSIRASMAQVFINEFKLSKYEAAKLIGVSPAAISNYLEGKRGDKYVNKILSDSSRRALVREAALIVLTSPNDPSALSRLQDITCELCSSVNEVAQAYGCHYLNSRRARDRHEEAARNI